MQKKPLYNYAYKAEEEKQEANRPSLIPGLLSSLLKGKNDDEDGGKLNHIYFYDHIDVDTMLELSKKIKKVELELLQLALKYDLQEKPKIYLHLNSLGGCIFSAFTVIDTILQSKIPVVTIVEGACASSATLISVAGHERWISEYGYFLMHQLSSCHWGKMYELEDELDNSAELMRRIKAHYVRFTGGVCKENELDEILKHDIWWTAQDCLERGLVDKVMTGNPADIGSCINLTKKAKKRKTK